MNWQTLKCCYSLRHCLYWHAWIVLNSSVLTRFCFNFTSFVHKMHQEICLSLQNKFLWFQMTMSLIKIQKCTFLPSIWWQLRLHSPARNNKIMRLFNEMNIIWLSVKNWNRESQLRMAKPLGAPITLKNLDTHVISHI